MNRMNSFESWLDDLRGLEKIVVVREQSVTEHTTRCQSRERDRQKQWQPSRPRCNSPPRYSRREVIITVFLWVHATLPRSCQNLAAVMGKMWKKPHQTSRMWWKIHILSHWSSPLLCPAAGDDVVLVPFSWLGYRCLYFAFHLMPLLR